MKSVGPTYPSMYEYLADPWHLVAVPFVDAQDCAILEQGEPRSVVSPVLPHKAGAPYGRLTVRCKAPLCYRHCRARLI